MCGITGYIDVNAGAEPDVIQRMTDTLLHRGPDGGGTFISKDGKVTLGHRRLSFLDLSENGKQPMQDFSETLAITFNGEVYNYKELRDELRSEYTFSTNSDTEVILAGYRKWGIGVISKLKGMFAFGLLDEDKQQLFLVRDRFGIKPLYFSLDNEKLIFASELKAILASGKIKREIDYSAFADYFVYRYIPSPKTIWKGVKKLPPAHCMTVDLKTWRTDLSEYWDLRASCEREDEALAIRKTGDVLKNSLEEHARADVPVGAFLSGGYDSSALVSYLCKSGNPPDTFSIGFSNWEKSEDQFAKVVADHLKVSNKSVVADESSLGLIDIMPSVYDEPIADISIIPTFMVSKLARTDVKAVVSGEGADEIFGGYTWQHEFYSREYPDSFWGKLKQKLFPGDSVAFYAQAMAMGWFDNEELEKMLHPDLHRFIPEDVHWFYRKNFRKELTPIKGIQYMDMKCFMGELVLTKIDRASMANSLEVRVPFLDHTLFEYVFSLDESVYFKKEQTKYLLYKNIQEDLPDEILLRKKQGFVGPDVYYMNLSWYRNQLKNSKLVEYKLINQSYIDELLEESYNWKLWKILVMEKWFQKWMCDL